MRLPSLKILGILVGIWIIVGGVIFFARHAKVTPESIAAYADTHPIAGKSAGERGKIIEELAGKMNRLPYDDRREVRMSRGIDRFFRDMTAAEQMRFLDLTLPTGFKQMMEALNKMTPEKRKAFVEKSLADMKKRDGDRPPDAQIDDNAKKIIDQGFKSFYSDASADVKMDVAPLIEQLQKNLQGRAMNPRTRGAFTLVELLVVFAVVAILAALAYPAFQRVIQSGRATACTSNLRQLGTALAVYLGENNNTMPTLKTARASLADDVPVIDNTLDKYVTSKGVFACPADQQGFATRTGTSYVWNVTLNGQALASLNFLGLVEDHSRIPIMSDKEGFHPYLADKVNILYADGHATKDVKFFTNDDPKK